MQLSPDPSTTQLPERIEFGVSEPEHLVRQEDTPERQLYYFLLNVDEHHDVLPRAFGIVERHLDHGEAVSHELPEELQFFEHTRASFQNRMKAIRGWRRRSLASLTKVDELSEFQRAYLLRQLAPMGLVDGCLLQNISGAATSHTRVTAELLKLYAREIGDADPARNHANLYRDLLHGSGLYLPETTSWAFVQQYTILDSSFSYPVLLLSLSQFPRVFLPELLGFTLHYYWCGVYPFEGPLGEQIAGEGGSSRFLDLHGLGDELGDAEAFVVEAVDAHLNAAGAGDDAVRQEQWKRIWHGFVTAYTAHQTFLKEIFGSLDSAEGTPRSRMVEMIRRKAPVGHGYHGAAKLGGRRIDDMLNPDSLDPEGLLEGLAGSHYVKAGDSSGSVFFGRLVHFGGPMFRVFSPSELATIAEWIDSLPENGSTEEPENERRQPQRAGGDHVRGTDGIAPAHVAESNSFQKSVDKYSKMPLGDAYYHLINAEYFPDVMPFAKDFATNWLARARRGLRRGEMPLPFEDYTPEAMDKWVHDRHRFQVESYRPLDGKPIQSKEELVNATTQLAPMILIDGAWVENMSNAATSYTDIGSMLFHIYSDEVGNGQTELNHPNVFRELLAEMGVHPPPTHYLEFARWPNFTTAAFEVPVFWLSVSRFPKFFRSEILGLNMAMEISGVGGTYREAIDTLRYYGFSPYFIELHNTIDNASTGHTAIAREAIKLHLDEILARGGDALVKQHWERVWTGFRALKPPPRSFVDSLKNVAFGTFLRKKEPAALY